MPEPMSGRYPDPHTDLFEAALEPVRDAVMQVCADGYAHLGRGFCVVFEESPGRYLPASAIRTPDTPEWVIADLELLVGYYDPNAGEAVILLDTGPGGYSWVARLGPDDTDPAAAGE